MNEKRETYYGFHRTGFMKVVFGEKIMKRLTLVLLLLILLIVAIPAGVTYADPGFDRVIGEGETVEEDIVVFGGTLLIAPGARVDGSVSVFGGEAELAGTIEGDVAIFGGQATISGLVDGDMAVLGGDLRVADSASVEGDCVLLGGTISGEGQDSIGCTGFGDLPNLAIPAFVGSRGGDDLPSVPPLPNVRQFDHGPSFFARVGSAIGRTIFLALAALVLVVAAPNQLNQVSSALRRKPGAAGAVGLFTFIAAVCLITIVAVISALLILVCIGILGIPLVIVMSLALLGALVMGWVAAGSILGQKMANRFNMSSSQVGVTVLGTVTLTIAAGLFSALPWWLGGWVFWLVAAFIGCAGLGAAALTRFGTRAYPVGAVENDIKVDMVMETMPVEDIDLDLDEEINLDPPEKPPVD